MGNPQTRRSRLNGFHLFAGVLIMLGLFLLLVTSVLSHVSSENTKGTREVLCIGIERNTANTARFDPRVEELCGEVGVHPIQGGVGG